MEVHLDSTLEVGPATSKPEAGSESNSDRSPRDEGSAAKSHDDEGLQDHTASATDHLHDQNQHAPAAMQVDSRFSVTGVGQLNPPSTTFSSESIARADAPVAAPMGASDEPSLCEAGKGETRPGPNFPDEQITEKPPVAGTRVTDSQPLYHDGILSRRKSMPPSPRKPADSLPTASPAAVSSRPTLLPSSSPHRPDKSSMNAVTVPHAETSLQSSTTFPQVKAAPAEESEMDDGDDATVDDEGGVIRCICGYDTDDGFTIQCERCLVWQHCACFGMSQASVPDEYLCEICDPREVNVAFAQQHQQRRREAEARKVVDTARRLSQSQQQQQQQLDQSRVELWSQHQQEQLQLQHQQQHAHLESSAAQHVAHPASPLAEGQSCTPPQSQAHGRSRKPTLSVDPSQTPTTLGEQPTSKSRKKGPASKTGRKTPAPESGAGALALPAGRAGSVGAGSGTNADAFTSSGAINAANSSLTSIAEAEDRNADRSEAWHAEFTPISRSLIVEPRVLNVLAAAMADYEKGDAEPWPTQPSSSGTGVLAPIAGPVAALDSPEDLEPSGLAAVGNECVPVAISGASLASLQQPTYVKHISEGAAASIFSNVQSIAPLPTEPARPWCASRIFSRPTMHGLFADSQILAGTFVAEYRGELLSAEAYRANPINQYAQVGTVKPHVHLFPPPLAMAIDARRFGTEARFARASCHPNAVLRPILFTSTGEAQPTKTDDASYFRNLESPFERSEGEPQLLFGIFAIADIPRTHEITLGWEWDDEHIVHLLPLLVRDPALGLPPAPPGGEGASAAALAAAAIAAKVASGVRTTERERRSAAMATLAERGEFPYANARFAASMNALLAVLLGMSLCACIGSAVPPGGQGGTASAHNSRKQDCAIAQMLRLAQGMAPLNVTMPGNKSHRKIRQPDFLPLVGVRRWWRPVSLPPMPETTPDEAASQQQDLLLRHLHIPFKRTQNGLVGRVSEDDYLRAIAEAQRNTYAGIKAGHLSGSEDDQVSQASSLTEPLSGLSDFGDDDDDDDDVSAFLSNSGTIDLRPEGTEQEDAWETPRLLPLKKRVSGTRLKATYSDDENSDAERAGAAGRRRASKVHTTPLPTPGQAQHKAARKSTVSGARRMSKSQALLEQTRKLKSRARPRKDDLGPHTPHQIKLQGDTAADLTEPRPSGKKRRRKSKKLHEPSSPLTSAPDDGKGESSEESLSPAPTLQRNLSAHSLRGESLKHALESNVEGGMIIEDAPLQRPDKQRKASLIPSESESERTARSASPAGERTAQEQNRKKRKAREATLEISQSAISRRNAERLAASKALKLQKKQKRLSLADLRDSESSGEERAQPRASSNKRQRSDSPDKKTMRVANKVKKTRLIVSTDESDLEDVPAAAPATLQAQDGTGFGPSQAMAQEPVLNAPHAAYATEGTFGDAEQTSAQVSQAAPPRAEPARAKLTLAEYKKRLAERQANEAAASAGPPTPSDVQQSPGEILHAGHPTLGMPSASILAASGNEVQQSPVLAGDFFANRYAPPAPRPPRPATPPRSVPPSPVAQPIYSSAAVNTPLTQTPAHAAFTGRPGVADFAHPSATTLHSTMSVDIGLARGSTNPGAGSTLDPSMSAADRYPRTGLSTSGDDVYSRGDSMSPRKSTTGQWPLGSAASPVRATPMPPTPDHIGADGVGGRSVFRPGFRPVVPPSPITPSQPSPRPSQTPIAAPRPPAAPAAFNPPRGPKALLNASSSAASQGIATSTITGRGEVTSPIVSARRMHSNSVSNASASSMSPPAPGNRLPSTALGAVPGHSVDVGGSRSSSGSFSLESSAAGAAGHVARPAAIDDFAGVPRGPRGSEDGSLDSPHTIPPPREGPGAVVTGGSPPGMSFRGRGRGWMGGGGGGSRGFPRGGGWGGRARGDPRRGRGRGW